MNDEISTLDATAQAELVRRGELTPEEAVEAAIARIERLNPGLNAVIHPLCEKARETAKSGPADGPFRGVPFLVKDAVCHTAGDPFHAGMRFLKERGFVAERDTELARRFRAAGFVFVGKTNTPELAMSATTEPLAYGATHNPWELDHSPAMGDTSRPDFSTVRYVFGILARNGARSCAVMSQVSSASVSHPTAAPWSAAAIRL